MNVYYMRTQHPFVGKVQLKDKIQIGAAIEDLETPPEDMSVQGRDLLTGKPKQVEVSYREIKALDNPFKELKMLLWKLSNSSRISSRHLQYRYLSRGGGSMLRGLDKRISQKNRLPVYQKILQR
jgi:rod shape-determining protein MreB